MRNTYLIVGIVVVLIAIIAFTVVRSRLPKIGSDKNSPTPAQSEEITEQPTITASTHTPASKAVIDAVTLTQPGFVAVYADNDGQPGEILGTSNLLSIGRHENVVIQLSMKTLDGQRLFAQIHVDNGNGVFERDSDVPAKDNTGNSVTIQINVSTTGTGTNGFQIPATGLGEDSY